MIKLRKILENKSFINILVDILKIYVFFVFKNIFLFIILK